MTEFPKPNVWASRLAKVCVVLTLFLILIGAIVTTAGAGMAAPTAPHVDGTYLNPLAPGTNVPWWQDPMLFKEHTHRLVAIALGISIGALTALLWKNWVAYFVAIAVMGAAAPLKRLGIEEHIVAHLRIWPAMIVFITLLIVGAKRRGWKPGIEQWLVLAAYVMACVQALFGTLRVELETWGYVGLATNIRVFHGVFAQAFLTILVIVAARLSPIWDELRGRGPHEFADKFRRMAVSLLVLYFIQLALAAYIRHNGLGLVIATWPAAQQDGSLLPAAWSHAVGVHFLHSRVVPFLILGHVIGLAIVVAKRAGIERLSRVSWGILALTVVQILLGVMVIWKGRHAHITNTHVMTGALMCAATALLIARSRALMPARA